MIHVQSLFGPMCYGLSRYGLNPHISAVFLQPIVFDGSEGFGALAAEIMSGELDVGPPVSCESDVADLSALVEGGEGKEAHLILLSLMLITFYL